MSASLSTALVVEALDPVELAAVRRAGVDRFGHPLRVRVADVEPGIPLRCCLREARVGEQVALLAWRPLRQAPDSVYAEVGPVYVHADACDGYATPHAYPEGFRHRQQVVRSYSPDGDMLQAAVTDGATAEAAIARLLDDPRAAVVHSRNVAAGCYMFAVRRARVPG